MGGIIMYGIMITGCGKHTCFSIQKVLENGTVPVNGKVYGSFGKAMNAARELGLHIIGCGSLYRLLSLRKMAENRKEGDDVG